MRRAAWVSAVLCCACTLDAKIVALEGGGDEFGESDSIGDDGGEGTGEESTSGEPPRFDIPVDGEVDLFEDPGIPRTCAEASANPSSMGCVFYGLDLDQPGLLDPIPHGVVLINVHPDQPATVKVETHAPAGWTLVEASAISPETSLMVELDDDALLGSGRFERGSYRVISDRPIAAVALSSSDTEATWSTATMSLMPAEGWGNDTLAAGWRSEADIGESDYVSVVASVDASSIEIYASAETQPGGGLEILDPEFPLHVDADAGDVVQLAALPGPNPDLDRGLAGTRVVTGEEHRVGVFSSHACAAIPSYESNCGHMAGQMLSALAGEKFIVAGALPNDPLFPTPTLWQVFALEDTLLVFDGAPGTSGLPETPLLLKEGEQHELWVHGGSHHDGRFQLSSSGRIALVRVTTSPPAGFSGGTSLAQMVPSELGLLEQWVYAPSGYERQQLIIAREPDVEVRLDGLALESWQFSPVNGAIGSPELARIDIEPGLHIVDADQGVTVTVSGERIEDAYTHIGGWGTPIPAHPPAG